MLGLTDRLSAGVDAVLDRRLAPNSSAPLALALSGGGDSRALALIVADWARTHGRPLALLTIDHRLSPLSGDWTAACEQFAARLELPFRALAWEGEKPAQGVPAAARAARHRLLANAARDLGARVILMGHTASDLAEAAAMRAAGSTTPSPREWAPSPAWPQGRDLFLLRPMLHLQRDEIRQWLAARAETWIDDPSNDDLRFARARARAAGAAPAAEPPPLDLAAQAAAARVDAAGVVSLPRAALSERFIAIASLCAAGTARPPRADRLARVAGLLKTNAPVVATLAGARIETRGDDVLFMREPGEMTRAGLQPLPLAPGETAVWDGRFEFKSDAADQILIAAPVQGGPPHDAASVRAIAPKARAALPVLALRPPRGLTVRCLVQDRLLAACGAIQREP